jgi:DNA-binding protein HU-beta
MLFVGAWSTARGCAQRQIRQIAYFVPGAGLTTELQLDAEKRLDLRWLRATSISRLTGARWSGFGYNLQKEIVMPPAKKSTAAPKTAPVAAVNATPAVKAAPAAAKKVAAPKMVVKKAPAATKKAAAPGKSPIPPKAAQTTITSKQIAAELAANHDLQTKQTETLLDAFVALATRHLKAGDKVRLTGLGILQVQARAARVGRNPATGAAIQIAASKKIAFRPAKELKEAV